MSPYIISLFGVFICGLLDRLRGDKKHILNFKFLDKIALGLGMVLASGFYFDPVVAPIIVIGMIIGMSFGWGGPLGAIIDGREMTPDKNESWQKGKLLQTNVWAALTFRGFMWGLPVALGGLAAFFGGYPQALKLLLFIPAYMIAFPTAVLFALSNEGKNSFGEDPWGAQEYYRGWLAALIVFLGTLI